MHYAPHLRMAVRRFGADFVACSAYKFFGPHAGLLWGRRALLEEIEAYKVRPAAELGAEKWQTGTANFEAIAGVHAAIEYLAELGFDHATTPPIGRREALAVALQTIEAHERALCAQLLRGLAAIPGVRIVGIADPERIRERCPTVSFTHPRRAPSELAQALADKMRGMTSKGQARSLSPPSL